MTKKRKILFLASNPRDSSHLRLEDEAKLIRSALKSNGNGELFDFYNVGAATISDLRQSLLNYKPNIVHFSGHGSEEDTILFEDNDGYTKEVNSDTLGEFFAHFNDTIECVILNACYSAKQAIGIKNSVKVLIGMSSEIPNDSAGLFTKAFYEALCADCEIEEAFNIARSSLKLEQESDAHIPIIHINENLISVSEEQITSNGEIENLLISEAYFKETRQSTRNKIIFYAVATLLIICIAVYFFFYFRNQDQYSAYAGGTASLLSFIPLYEMINKKGDMTLCNWLWQERQQFLQRASTLPIHEVEEFNKKLQQSLMKIIKGGK